MDFRKSVLTILFWCCSLSLLEGGSCGAVEKVGCRDQNGRLVDWYMAYKLPKLKENPNHLINEGYGLMYLDSNDPSKWVLSPVTMETSNQAVGYTLQQYYDRKNDNKSFYMLYNDEHPDGNWTELYGHTKGNMVFDDHSGYWMIHSAPKFPQTTEYAWAQNARTYGQSFFCISFPYSTLNSIGKQLLYTMPFVYDYQLPSNLIASNPNMIAVIKNETIEQPPWNNLLTVKTLSGDQTMIHFAKHTNWGHDLYFDFVAPALETSLLVETWQNGGGNLTSWCDGNYHVNNVFDIDLPGGITFSDHHDHSKWAVSADPDKKWICNGDINRQYHQLKRGGGTMCIELDSVWGVYRDSVKAVQPCSSQFGPLYTP